MNDMQRGELDDCCLMTCVRFTAGEMREWKIG